MANCSQCHQPGGSAQQASWDARITTPTALAGLVNGTLANNLGTPSNHVITPLSPTNSVLLARVSTRGAGSIQMPPLDSNLVDMDATNILNHPNVGNCAATTAPFCTPVLNINGTNSLGFIQEKGDQRRFFKGSVRLNF